MKNWNKVVANCPGGLGADSRMCLRVHYQWMWQFLTIQSLSKMGRLQLVSQTPDLIVGHGQPARTLLQVPLQAATLLLQTAVLTSQWSVLLLHRHKHKSSTTTKQRCPKSYLSGPGTSWVLMLRITCKIRKNTWRCSPEQDASVVQEPEVLLSCKVTYLCWKPK